MEIEIENQQILSQKDFFDEFCISENLFYKQETLYQIPYISLSTKDFRPYNLIILKSQNQQKLQKISKLKNRNIVPYNSIYMWQQKDNFYTVLKSNISFLKSLSIKIRKVVQQQESSISVETTVRYFKNIITALLYLEIQGIYFSHIQEQYLLISESDGQIYIDQRSILFNEDIMNKKQENIDTNQKKQQQQNLLLKQILQIFLTAQNIQVNQKPNDAENELQSKIEIAIKKINHKALKKLFQQINNDQLTLQEIELQLIDLEYKENEISSSSKLQEKNIQNQENKQLERKRRENIIQEGNIIFSLDYLQQIIEIAQIMCNDKFNNLTPGIVNDMETNLNKIHNHKKFTPEYQRCLENVQNKYCKAEWFQHFDSPTKTKYVVQTFTKNAITYGMFENYIDSMQLLKSKLKQMHIQKQVVDLKKWEFFPQDKKMYIQKGICSLLTYSISCNQYKQKWYDSQNDLQLIAGNLINIMTLLHQNELYFSDLNLKTLSISLNQENGKTYDISINDWSAITQRWDDLKQFSQDYYPPIQKINIDQQKLVFSENHRRYCDFYQIGRILQLIMLSSVENFSANTLENNDINIQKSFEILKNYYNKQLMEQLQNLLEEYESAEKFEQNLKNITKIQKLFQYEKEIEQQQKMEEEAEEEEENEPVQLQKNEKNIRDIEKLEKQFVKNEKSNPYTLKLSKNTIDMLVVNQSVNLLEELIDYNIQVLNIADVFHLDKSGALLAQFYYEQNDKYFTTLEIHETQQYLQLTYLMGRIFEKQQQYNKALQFYLMHRKTARDNNLRLQAEIMSSMGYCHSKLKGEMPQAEEQYKQSLIIKQSFYESHDLSIIKTRNRYAFVLFLQHKFEEAYPLYLESEKGMEKLGLSETDEEYIALLTNLGIISFRLKKEKESDYYFSKVIQIKKINQIEDFQLVEALEKLATLYTKQSNGREKEIIALYKESIAIKKKIIKNELDRRFVDPYINIGYQLAFLGEQFVSEEYLLQAKTYFEIGIKLMEYNFDISTNLQLGDVYKSLANVLSLLNLDIMSEPYLKACLKIYNNHYGPNGEYTLEIKRELEKVEDQKKLYNKYPEILEGAKKMQKVFGHTVEDYTNVLSENQKYNADQMIQKIQKGELKIKLGNGTILEANYDPQIQEDAKKMVINFGGDDHDYYELLKTNTKFTVDQIIMKIRNGSLKLQIAGKELRPVDIVQEEEKLNQKKQVQINSEFFPSNLYLLPGLSFKEGPIKKKILEFNQNLQQNSNIAKKTLSFNLNSELKSFETLLHFIVSDSPQLELQDNEIEFIKQKLLNWPIEYQVPIFDLLRFLALKPQIKRLLIGSTEVQIVQTCCDNILQENQKLPIIGVFLTFLVHICKTSSYFVISNQKQIIPAILTLLEKRGKEIQENKNFMSYLSSFFFNYIQAACENSQKIFDKFFVNKIIKEIFLIFQNVLIKVNIPALFSDQEDLENQKLKYLVSIANIILAQIDLYQEVLSQNQIQNLIKKENLESKKCQQCYSDIIQLIQKYESIILKKNN